MQSKSMMTMQLGLVALLLGCTEPTEPTGPTDHTVLPARELAVWSEFLTDDQVRESFALLEEEQVDLYLAIPSERVGDPGLERLIFDARASGVGVRAWLLLPKQDGYWPNEHNIEAMRTATMQFAEWREAAQLPINWLIFDMEMSLQRTEAFTAAMENEGLQTALALLEAGRDPELFSVSRDDYTQLVTDLQAQGLQIMAVTYPMVLDDPEDGDDDIQDKFDVPITGVPWDQVSFMVYQSLFFDLTGQWYGPDLVKSYGDSATAQFGEQAALALGIVGTTGITPVAMPYPDPTTLLRDHQATKACGISSVSIYSLDGILQQDTPRDWLDASVTAQMPEVADADELRAVLRTLLD